MSYGPRLAFYSDQEAHTDTAMHERVMGLIGRPRPRIGYVASSADPERRYFERTRQHYAKRGAELDCYVDVDLMAQGADTAALFASDAIHLSGGNTFEFLAWLKSYELARRLIKYAAGGGVLIGVSAGAMILTPSVASAELCGDARLSTSFDDAGLALVDFHFWPHYVPSVDAAWSGAKLTSSLNNLYGCPDGSGIVVDGSRIEMFGKTVLLNR